MHFFNNGDGCGPNGVACDVVDVCPSDDDVTSYVMSANMGGHCSDGGNINMDSVVLKLERAGSSITLMGVFISVQFDLMLQYIISDYLSICTAPSYAGAQRCSSGYIVFSWNIYHQKLIDACHHN